MRDKKICWNCQRQIDPYAKLCPYCNRDQEAQPAAAPAAVSAAPAAAAATPPPPPRVAPDRRWTAQALVIAAVVALLMATFAVGGLVYGLGKRGDDTASSRDEEQVAVAAGSPELPDLTLVPESDDTTTIGRSITSTPIPDPDHKYLSEAQRTDATALPSQEYAKIIARAEAEQAKAQSQGASVDPRTITAPPPPPPPVRKEPSSDRPRSAESDPISGPTTKPPVRTLPQPLSQPLPRWSGRESGTLRFQLTVGRDGRVKEVRVIETIPDMTAKAIAAVQRWRFKPATLNGEPVEGTFDVDITFKGSDD